MQSSTGILRELMISISVFLACAAAANAQPTCPGAPDEHVHGELTVLEGPAFGGSGGLATGMDATVAVDQPEEGPARFLVGWRNNITTLSGTYAGNRIYLSRFQIDGTCIEDEEDFGPQYVSEIYTGPTAQCSTWHFAPSLAMSRDGFVLVTWLSQVGCSAFTTALNAPGTLHAAALLFDDSPSTWPRITAPNANQNRYGPSAGVSDGVTETAGVSWSQQNQTSSANNGLVFTVAPINALNHVEACSDFCWARVLQWTPCMAMRDDGYFAICWSKAEVEEEADPPFNIALQLFDPTGDLVGDVVIVNDTDADPENTSQTTPAVSFDSSGNIVVVWLGPTSTICDETPPTRIFARRLFWDGGASEPEKVGEQILVDHDYDLQPNFGMEASPTVALSRAGNGRYIVAWNVTGSLTGLQDIYAQFFEHDRPLGRKFRFNQQASTFDSGNGIRRLAASRQHTVAYTADDEVVGVWSRIVTDNPDPENAGEKVYFTILPPGFGDYQVALGDCCKGDMDGSETVTLDDVPLFVDALLAGGVNPTACVDLPTWFCRADCNSDGYVNGLDIKDFMALVFGSAECEPAPRELADCNANGIPDSNDIAFGRSQDCNHNQMPDECDIAAEASTDVNSNDIPDDCEPDCNLNQIPDAWDISEEESTDCNANGIPDECERDCNANGVPDDCDVNAEDPDGDEWVSPDCNENGIPDECEIDCNENGVPDDCDLDPLDPDGDEHVSADCNANGLPDECDLALPPPFGSYDCNDNDVPDECDIADETSCDANENGVPDECEIALETCDDLDEDDCCDEGESLMGGGEGGGESIMGGEGGGDSSESSSESESSDSQSPCAELTEAECWDLYFEWAMEQCWGPNCEATGLEQYHAARQKLAELGLTWPM
ncbi:MAG: hypothetical protein HRU71_12865 [Planctomycetia bacterium]|nr:MAG: hypothetical protein HRU71_12865 [Planctomycetia bacterium]